MVNCTFWRVRLSVPLVAGMIACCALVQAEDPDKSHRRSLPSAQEMAAAKTDVWGQAAIQDQDGPSFEFYQDLLPPLRYVNTDFRHYPIVISAPAGKRKSRWVSNGSAINARANKKPMWREVGFPVHFRVGKTLEPFGLDLERLDGPRYADGFLPIVQLSYRTGEGVVEQEAFAVVTESLADAGAVLVRFTARKAACRVTAEIKADSAIMAVDGGLRNSMDKELVQCDPSWRWQADERALSTDIEPDRSAVLMVYTVPASERSRAVDQHFYDSERRACVDTWRDRLAQGIHLEIPEQIVQNAWRSLVIGNYLIADGERMNYSAGNAYDHLYEGECGDAVRALMLFGQTADARRMVGPLLDFDRRATRFHVAGHKLQLLAHYYWVTRDAGYLREKEPVWKPVVELIVSSRDQTTGLLPKDNYAGDIAQQVYSLNSNANCWRGLRDMAAVLADMGDERDAKRLFDEAKSFRAAILDAVARSERRDATPPFIPNALLSGEEPYETLTATRFGSYYDLMAPYIIGSGVFGVNAGRETWMIEYLRQHGGIAMGMIRSTPHQGEFKGEPGANVLYGLRYMLALLRRDDREAALAGFYGQLAQAMTRDTFIGGEGSRFFHGDRHGRSFYLPPNSASNAMFLSTLRYLLVQDWDVDDDGAPETLRLLYGMPHRWLRGSAVLKMERAPTAFGEISLHLESRIDQGEVLVELEAPKRRPEKLLLRLPMKSGWKVGAATVGDVALPIAADGSVDLSSQTDAVKVRFQVESPK